MQAVHVFCRKDKMAVRALTLAFPIVFVAYNAVQGFLRMDPENTADGSADIRTGDHQPTARISTGIVQGFSGTSREGRTFYQFLGLPYAQPPVGDLRFEVKLVSFYTPYCFQQHNLNVFISVSSTCDSMDRNFGRYQASESLPPAQLHYWAH